MDASLIDILRSLRQELKERSSQYIREIIRLLVGTNLLGLFENFQTPEFMQLVVNMRDKSVDMVDRLQAIKGILGCVGLLPNDCNIEFIELQIRQRDILEINGPFQFWSKNGERNWHGKYKGTLNTARKPHGRGSFIGGLEDAGREFHGDWYNGLQSGNGYWKYPSGAVYAGQVTNTRNGRGIYWTNDGLKCLHGRWDNGFARGMGRIMLENGEVWDIKFGSRTRPDGDGAFMNRIVNDKKSKLVGKFIGVHKPPVDQPVHFGHLQEWDATIQWSDGTRERLKFRGLEEVRGSISDSGKGGDGGSGDGGGWGGGDSSGGGGGGSLRGVGSRRGGGGGGGSAHGTGGVGGGSSSGGRGGSGDGDGDGSADYGGSVDGDSNAEGSGGDGGRGDGGTCARGDCVGSDSYHDGGGVGNGGGCEADGGSDVSSDATDPLAEDPTWEAVPRMPRDLEGDSWHGNGSDWSDEETGPEASRSSMKLSNYRIPPSLPLSLPPSLSPLLPPSLPPSL